jgi:hypothetical protein
MAMTMLENETPALGLVAVGAKVGVEVRAGVGIGVQTKEDAQFRSHRAKVEAEGEGGAMSAHVLHPGLPHIVETIPATDHGHKPLCRYIRIRRIQLLLLPLHLSLPLKYHPYHHLFRKTA